MDTDMDYDMLPFVLHRLKDVGGEPIGHSNNRIFLVVKGMQVWLKNECVRNFLHEEYKRGRPYRVASDGRAD